MQRKPHPNFAARFNKHFLYFWCATVLFVVLCGIAFHLKYHTLGAAFCIIWGTIIAVGLGVLYWHIKHHPCPTCGAMLKAMPDKKENSWISECHTCNVKWDLGIGCDND